MRIPAIFNPFKSALHKISPPKVEVPAAGTAGKYLPVPRTNLPNVPSDPHRVLANQNFKKLLLDMKSTGAAGAKLPSHSHPAPKTMGDVVQNMITADRLVKAGVFKTGPDLKTVTRDAFVNAAVNGLVSTPLSIATYAGSVWSGEQIKGAFSANTPLLPPAHQPAPSQQSKGAAGLGNELPQPSAQDLQLRLENAELKLLLTANTIQSFAEGGKGLALDKSAGWPTESSARLDHLEKLYDAAETSLKALAEHNEFIFKPYKNPLLTPETSMTSRLDVLDKRNEVIQKMIVRMLNVLQEEAPQESAQVV
ncbi:MULTISPECIES: hypothetical protein [Pseudomonas]|uniref:hypothetical protein n=1 Tax=Pseudomonas TaxID=286 RepID=UPI0039900CCE